MIPASTNRWQRAGAHRRLLVAMLMSMALISVIKAQAAPNFAGKIARPLHYYPNRGDFVVENGKEFFNRPLYGTNTAFRADAGDKPEILLYLPGRGGNLRIGIKTAAGAKWLNDAASIVTRYRPGSMLYDIRDPLLGDGMLHLAVLAMSTAEGLVMRAELHGTATPLELVWAYGGGNGARLSRNGDIGTDRIPMSEYFQFKPEYAGNQTFSVQENTFALQGKRANIVGLVSPDAKLAVADGMKWTSLVDLLASAGQKTKLPVLVGQAMLQPQQPLYLSLERVGAGTESQEAAKPSTFIAANLPQVFEASEQHRRAIAERVIVNTPDPYINAAVPALNVAMDGVWDESQGVFMHGAVAWRNKLLGWRGPYSGDALGWHDRTRRHLMNWLPKQNTKPSPDFPFPQDANVNFARNEPMLHTDGDLTNSHYDMNLVAIDVLFRHFLWTGDIAFAREVWPVVERHMAWERRCFRRPFGPDKLPLYEAYACIWASDDLQYNGGGVTHSSAYNYYHNKMAARMAKLLGKDGSSYEREAELIHKTMRRELWLADRGWFAEWKDLLGLQLVHPNDGVWTFYHTIDSEVPSPREAWQMTRFIDTQIPHIPIQGPGVLGGNYTLSTTSWMPYAWSINNVVMAEASHTALGYWQAGRSDEAFRLFKGLLLDSMYQGLCPGNVGMTTYFDMARGESQRDFADAVGTTSRTLVEGLFGVKPDALAGELRVRPGFPADWNHTSIRHPDFTIAFRRQNLTDTYTIESGFPKPMALRLNIAARRDSIASVTVNGGAARWKPVEDAIGLPRIEIRSAAVPRQQVVIIWKGEKPENASAPAVVAKGAEIRAQFGRAKLREVADPQQALTGLKVGPASFRAIATGTMGHRSVFARVQQGQLSWWVPVTLEIRPAYEVVQSQQQDANHIWFAVRNNTATAINRMVTMRSGVQMVSSQLKTPALGASDEISLPAKGLMPGSNRVAVDLGNGKFVEGVVTNWMLNAGDATKWEAVNLTPVFNDKVTRIFQNEYSAPRSAYVSLAVPKQGIGSWVHWDEKFEVDDSGLRAVADQHQGRLILPQGIPLQTPGAGDARNIAFTSQWDNFPREITVPLSGKASHAYFLMAGSTNWMQSRFDNGDVIVTYSDGSTERLALHNPTTWWPIDQDYKIDDFAFRRPEPIPPRVNLKSGDVRVLDPATFKGKGGKVPGGAATVLDLPLHPQKELKSLTVRSLANEVVIGLMAATLVRDGTPSQSTGVK
jgi:hypothetical protein